jgi:hypothetical protein
MSAGRSTGNQKIRIFRHDSQDDAVLLMIHARTGLLLLLVIPVPEAGFFSRDHFL